MTTTSSVDLTPFGFTKTESVLFSALVELGPSSAYELSKKLSLARANTYQALHGLRKKGAAVLVESSPQVFRASNPDALLAMITGREIDKLDRLESELARPLRQPSPDTQSFTSERAFREIALRTVGRAESLECVASAAVLNTLNPIWRKRAADGAGSSLWLIGQEEPDARIPLAGTVRPETADTVFGWEPALLLTEAAAIIGKRTGDGQMSGYWTSDSIFCALTRGAIGLLTSS